MLDAIDDVMAVHRDKAKDKSSRSHWTRARPSRGSPNVRCHRAVSGLPGRHEAPDRERQRGCEPLGNRIAMKTGDGETCVITFQVRMSGNYWRQPLGSQSEDTGSCWATTTHTSSTRRVRGRCGCTRMGNVFVVRMEAMSPHDAQKANGGRKDATRMLGELGFTRQEDGRRQYAIP